MKNYNYLCCRMSVFCMKVKGQTGLKIFFYSCDPDHNIMLNVGAVEFADSNNYPARACASKGLCDQSWCPYYYIIYCLDFFLEPIFYLQKYSL